MVRLSQNGDFRNNFLHREREKDGMEGWREGGKETIALRPCETGNLITAKEVFECKVGCVCAYKIMMAPKQIATQIRRCNENHSPMCVFLCIRAQHVCVCMFACCDS